MMFFLSIGVVPAGGRWDTSVRLCRTWRGRWSSGFTSTETTRTPPKRRKFCSLLALKWRWSRSVQYVAATKSRVEKSESPLRVRQHALKEKAKFPHCRCSHLIRFETFNFNVRLNQETDWLFISSVVYFTAFAQRWLPLLCAALVTIILTFSLMMHLAYPLLTFLSIFSHTWTENPFRVLHENRKPRKKTTLCWAGIFCLIFCFAFSISCL